jgi:hypothetical protein
MKTAGTDTGIFADRFKKSYLRSLSDYRFFYDDIAELGNPAEAEHVFYFVPGINGTPGQMRFMLPSLTRVFGPRVYLKALHLPEFSARVPIWEKYTVANVDKKLARLREDLGELLSRHDRFAVLCSSNGFYDFLAAASAFPAGRLEAQITLAWGACAPDQFEPTPWEKVFYPLNGFTTADGHRWFAYPNSNLFTVFNPETSTSFAWADIAPRRIHKVDLESRFRCGGLQWDYISSSQLGEACRHVVAQIERPWSARSEALVAANDGFWQGTPQPEIERRIRRYLPDANCVFENESHLWVVTPRHLTPLLERVQSLCLVLTNKKAEIELAARAG